MHISWCTDQIQQYLRSSKTNIQQAHKCLKLLPFHCNMNCVTKFMRVQLKATSLLRTQSHALQNAQRHDTVESYQRFHILQFHDKPPLFHLDGQQGAQGPAHAHREIEGRDFSTANLTCHRGHAYGLGRGGAMLHQTSPRLLAIIYGHQKVWTNEETLWLEGHSIVDPASIQQLGCRQCTSRRGPYPPAASCSTQPAQVTRDLPLTLVS